MEKDVQAIFDCETHQDIRRRQHHHHHHHHHDCHEKHVDNIDISFVKVNFRTHNKRPPISSVNSNKNNNNNSGNKYSGKSKTPSHIAVRNPEKLCPHRRQTHLHRTPTQPHEDQLRMAEHPKDNLQDDVAPAPIQGSVTPPSNSAMRPLLLKKRDVLEGVLPLIFACVLNHEFLSKA
uniref:Uncharacterized protein n=1 Tax=Glossina austeni TaxID=7395 RepID=A0A1A9UR43_GLOAU